MIRKRRRGLRMRAKNRSLHCEFLEDRRVLATFTVGDLGDTSDANPGDGVAADAAGNTTLRAAIEEANALVGADDINFSVAGTVNLTLGELAVSDDLVIDGGGATVDAGGLSRVLNASAGEVGLTNITLTNGSATLGGGVYSTTNLRLTNATVTGNAAGSAGAGIASFGGLLSLDASTVSYNESYQYGGGIFAVQGQVRVLNGSVVTGNSVNHTGAGYSSGAGIAVQNAAYITVPVAGSSAFDLVVADSTISNNVLYGNNFPYGSAVYSFGYGTIEISGSMITGNSATGSGGARGAAGFNWPAGAFGTGVTDIDITDTIIDGNYSSEESGGFGFRAFGQDNAVNLDMTRVTITNNVAVSGGGAGFNWSTGAATDPQGALFNIVDSTISGNSSGTAGGAFQLQNSIFSATDSTFDGNSSAAAGGAIYAAGATLDDYALAPPTTTFTRTTISNNYAAGNGGGVYGYDAQITLDNSTVSGNRALGPGGGLVKRTYYSYVGTAYETTIELVSSTVTANNSGATGGAIYGDYYSTIRAMNSIVSGNADSGIAADIYMASGTNVSAMYSLIGDASGTDLVPGNPDAAGNIIGMAGAPIDAMLGALANNGGSTLTHLPMAGSPAIDAGDPATMGGTDQTGAGRVANGRIDMGSVEVGGTTTVDGDFDDDMDYDCDDINALTAETAAGTNNPLFDLTGDGFVNGADIDAWLAEAGAANLISGNAYARGDANLDGIVDGLDFIDWNTNKFTSNTNWCDGNFNGDSVIDGLDFIEWNANKFTQQGPIVAGGETESTMDNLNESSTQRQGRQQLRMRQEGSGLRANAQVALSAANVNTAIGSTNAVQSGAQDSLRAAGDSSLDSYQVEQLSSSVSHADASIRDIDRVFAAL